MRTRFLRHCFTFITVFLAVSRAHAEFYFAITAANATVNSSGDIIEDGNTYDCVTKPTPPNLVSEGGNEYYPWIAADGGFLSDYAINYQINPSPESDGTYLSTTDKMDTTLSTGDDADALKFDSPKYLGFAVKIPSAGFSAPVINASYAGVQIAQWWQGSPYSPPLALDMIGENNGMVTYALLVHNDTTLGNPSSVPVIIGTGSIAFDSWNTFVVETDMDYSGSGQIQLWQNGNLLMSWTGAVGYNPSTIPYKNPPAGTADPNSAFNVYVGPYRPSQETEQSELFDDIRWASDYSDALPVAVPEPAGLGAVCGGALLLRRRARKR
jgi:hypothetical protein